mgnify:CR=1 FL=1
MSSFVESVDKHFICGKIWLFHLMELVPSFHLWNSEEVMIYETNNTTNKTMDNLPHNKR